MDVLGRDDELRVLDAFLAGAPEDGARSLVLEGEAGIGKSTLWAVAVETARERGLRVLVSRPAEGEVGVAYAGLGDLFDDALAEVAADLAPPRRRAVEAALLLRDDAPVDFRTLAVAVRNVLQLLAERSPTVVAVDDVQWLDAPTASALAFALRRLPVDRVRVLLARRIGEGGHVTPLELAVDAHRVERLRLAPLSVGALHGILQRQLERVIARPTLLRLHEASGGNPFFALELARALDHVPDPTQPLRVPENLEALVHARLDRLPASTQAALLLVCAHGRIRPERLDGGALDPALADDVIEIADGAVRFTHPLLATVLYQNATPEARREAHRRVAEDVGDSVSRARHRALASVEPDAQTARELERASAVANARGAPIVAAELGEHALRLTPREAAEDRCRRALATARAHLAAGEGDRPRELANILAAELAGAPRAAALVLLSELEEADRALALLQEALAEAAGDIALQGAIHQQLANLGRLIEGHDWAAEHALAALEIADRLDDDAQRAGAMSALALVRFNCGEPDALALARRAHDLAVAAGEPTQVRHARWALTHVLLWSAELDEARSLLAPELEWRDRDERWAADASWYLALVELFAGRWSLAAEYAELARVVTSQYGAEVPQLAFPVALVALHRGEFERACETAELGRDSAGARRMLLPGLVAIPGLAALWSGDAAGAVYWFAQAEERTTATGNREPTMRWWCADHVEALLELGESVQAETLLEQWSADATRVGRTWVLAHVRRCRGLAAAASGDVERAVSLLESAVAEHAQAGDPFGRARALLALGIVRRRDRQKRAARESLEAALAAFEELGAASWVGKAHAELGRIGGRARVDGLTPAETRVAALVVEGRTNREVAAALYLGERTVASHLTHIYSKLGVRSRTELAGKVQTF